MYIKILRIYLFGCALFNLFCVQAHNVDEDIAIGTSIMRVKASDADSGSNADIAYSVSDDHFAVDSNGNLANNRRLDADSNNAYYEFQVNHQQSIIHIFDRLFDLKSYFAVKEFVLYLFIFQDHK